MKLSAGKEGIVCSGLWLMWVAGNKDWRIWNVLREEYSIYFWVAESTVRASKPRSREAGREREREREGKGESKSVSGSSPCHVTVRFPWRQQQCCALRCSFSWAQNRTGSWTERSPLTSHRLTDGHSLPCGRWVSNCIEQKRFPN